MRAGSTSTQVRAQLDLYGVPYVLDPTLVRGLDYYSRTTFEFIGPDENANSVDLRRRPLRRPRRGRSAARRHPASASAPASSGCCSRSRTRAAKPRGRGSTSSSSSATDAPRERVLTALAELRRAGIVAPTRDYAGRSLKGQLTQAGRDARPHGRDRPRYRGGRSAAEGADERIVSLDDVVATLTGQ